MRFAPFLLSAVLLGCSPAPNKVTLYCAQDREFAEAILGQFSKSQAILVQSKFDTEANKSVSLYEEIVQESGRPRCDLFWNNEILSTIRLSKRGLLASHDTPEGKNLPAWARASDKTWYAFAARARVVIYNKNKIQPADLPQSILDLTQKQWKQKLVMAKPQYGTAATQVACHFEVLGTDAAKELYRGLRNNEIAIVPGNKQVAQRVAAGDFVLGLTDQDDAIVEIDARQPVGIHFLDQAGNHPVHPRLGTLIIPNSIGLISGSPHPVEGRKLMDHLLSTETEKRLSEGGAYQIPLFPNVETKLHPAIEAISKVKRMEVDFEKAAFLWEEAQIFIAKEFSP